MNILFVTPEIAPYSGTSSLAESCAALPKALKGLGHNVTVLSPLYGFVDPSARGLARRLRKIEVELGSGQKRAFDVYDTRTSAGVDLLFLGQEELLRPLHAVPREDGELQDGLCFGAFAKAALAVLTGAERPFDLVCCHDWQTALVPVLVRSAGLSVRSTLTIHDVAQQGLFPAALHDQLGLPRALFGIQGVEFYGKLGFLKGGVATADRLLTVSPTYAREIASEGGAAGLEGALRARGRDLVGIVGGVDGSLWNPATDPHLPSRYDPMDLNGKRRTKVSLQQELSLPVRDDVPLVVVPGAIAPGAGVDALARVLGRSMRNDLQLAIAHTEPSEPDPALRTVLEEHRVRWPDRLAVVASGEAALAHRLLGAADFVLVGGPREPGSTLQMKAHRYGALPIGLRRAAFADTVVDRQRPRVRGAGRRGAARRPPARGGRLRQAPRLRAGARSRDAHRPQLGAQRAPARARLPGVSAEP